MTNTEIAAMLKQVTKLKSIDSGELYTLRRYALLEHDHTKVNAVNFELSCRHRAAVADRDYGLGSCHRCGATLTQADVEAGNRCTQCGTQFISG